MKKKLLQTNRDCYSKGRLNLLPSSSTLKTGWPWTEETDPDSYQKFKHLPKISIVTPTLNQGIFIEETIRSILLQNYPNLEFIVIDGRSTDETIEILNKYNHWIDYWESEEDRGQTHAINKGFHKATGTYINWINSDDILAKNGLLNLLKNIQKYPDAGLVHGQSLVISENGNIKTYEPSRFSNFGLEYFGGFPYLQPASFFKRAILEKVGYLDESFDYTMDKDLFLRIALNFPIQYFDVPIAFFREQKDAKTYRYNEKWDADRNRVLNKLMRTVNAPSKIMNNLEYLNSSDNQTDYYLSNKQFSTKEIEEIFAIFLKDSIILNFHAHRFNHAFRLGNIMKTILPNHYSNKVAFYHNRAMFYRFKFIYLLTRPLAIFRKSDN